MLPILKIEGTNALRKNADQDQKEHKLLAPRSITVSFFLGGEENYSCRPLKVRPHLHTNTNEAGQGEAYANICFDCNKRQNVVIRRASEWFSLKYRLQADNVRSASDRTEAVFLSSVTRPHCYACLASACLARVFVLMWTWLKIVFQIVWKEWEYKFWDLKAKTSSN